MNQALESNKPPNGLIPRLTLNAHESNQELKVSSILTTAGLQICRALKDHYQTVFEDKLGANVALHQKLESHLANIPPGPEKDQLVTLVNEKAEQIRTKVCKRKTELASRLYGKR